MSSVVHKECVSCSAVFPRDTVICPIDGSELATRVSKPLVGLTLGSHYELLEEIGRGGMGMIYKAKHKKPDRSAASDIVAIKLLLNDAKANEIVKKRFMVEARAASSLNHPNIIKIHEYSVSEDGLPFMVMDYLDGTSLDELLKSGGMDIESTLKFMIDICDALSHAHRHNVVHRDLKPSNIMVIKSDDGTDKPILVDFGIAKIFTQPGKTSLRLTQTGEVFGSPLYMSPEQCMGQKLDGRADIYGLGCVIYECITGDCPFTGDNFLNIIFRHINDDPPRFARSSHEKALEEILLKALAKKPSDRYQSMTDLRKELEAYLHSTSPGKVDEEEADGEDNDNDDFEASDIGDDDIASGDRQFAYYYKLAQQGEAHAQLELALLYREGVFVEQDNRLAFEWCLKAATQGSCDASGLLGDMYFYDEVVESDYDKAFYWYSKAAAQDHPIASAQIAYMYDEGIGQKQNPDEALRWYKRAGSLEHIESQLIVGDAYLGLRTIGGDSIETNAKEGVKWYRRAANQGDSAAQLQLGLCYSDENYGVKLNLKEAIDWLIMASDQGNGRAQRHLAYMYEFGKGVEADDDRAMELMLEAADNGDDVALVTVASWYREGERGLPKDSKRALRYYRLGADAGNAEAMYQAGMFFLKGEGVARNYKTAIEFLKSAAEADQADAQFQLGLCYKDGRGVDKDETKLARWLNKAAEQNHLEAQFELGSYYRAINDNTKANAWLRRASSRGHLGADKLLQSLEKDAGRNRWKGSLDRNKRDTKEKRPGGTDDSGKKDKGNDKRPGGGKKK